MKLDFKGQPKLLNLGGGMLLVEIIKYRPRFEGCRTYRTFLE